MANLTDPPVRRKLPETFLMTDDVRHPDPAPAIACLPAGSAVIFRHYGTTDRERLAQTLARLCRSRDILFLVAADARLARTVNADGLHLPETLAFSGPQTWRLWRKSNWLVTAAAHSPAALERAGRAGADAALLSPVFPTQSHPGAPPIGPLRFAAWTRLSPVPVYALGGIIPAVRWRRLHNSGARGWASIGSFSPSEAK